MVKRPDDSAPEHDEALATSVWEALGRVHDPEIPPVAITDLGIVQDVRTPPGAVEVDLLPTFAGCPALDIIREDVEAALSPVAGERAVRVRFVNAPPWTSDRITPAGREAMRSYGLTPPPGLTGTMLLPVIPLTPTCPFCGSRDTVRESAFGPTLCRATHYCRSCRNPFESFKPKVMGPAPRESTRVATDTSEGPTA
jgi:ring-1,2-phenylacetyl-CoA epoxidase subunit PaaD